MMTHRYRPWSPFLAAAAAFLLMSAGAGASFAGPGPAAQPHLNPAFVDPVEAVDEDPDPNVVQVTLVHDFATINVNGQMAELYTYNGSYPWPTIRARQGDVVNILYRNELQFTTETNMLGFQRNHSNLHVHGWHVSPEEPSDAAHLDIPAGGSYDYSYPLQHQEAGTLCFYHGHFHDWWPSSTGAAPSARS